MFSWLQKRLFLSGNQFGSVQTALGITAPYRLMTQVISPPQHLPAEGTPHPGPWAGSVPATFPRRRQRRILMQPLTWSHSCASQLPTFRLIQMRVRQRSLPPNMGRGHKFHSCFLNIVFEKGRSENLWLGQHPARLRKRLPF